MWKGLIFSSIHHSLCTVPTENTDSNSSSIVECVSVTVVTWFGCRGNMFTESLPSKGRLLWLCILALHIHVTICKCIFMAMYSFILLLCKVKFWGVPSCGFDKLRCAASKKRLQNIVKGYQIFNLLQHPHNTTCCQTNHRICILFIFTKQLYNAVIMPSHGSMNQHESSSLSQNLLHLCLLE
jgi:hypothetical protein